MTARNIFIPFIIALAIGLTTAPIEAAQGALDTLPATAVISTADSPKETVASTESIPNIQFEKYKLKNGLEVILSEDHRLPLVSVNVWYHVGSENEPPGKRGLAHLFEHLMFEGSHNTGKQNYHQHLLAAGAYSINGYTSFDHTSYVETLPSNKLELALWLESDRMGSMLDAMDKEKLSIQQNVVRNERRENTESNRWRLMEESEYRELFPKDHPYVTNIMGSHADVESASIGEVREFARHYYTPNNASIAIVGDINSERVKQQIEKYFGSIQPGPSVAKIATLTPPIESRKLTLVPTKSPISFLLMSWLTPPIYKGGDAEAAISAYVLGGGKSSRLYKSLVLQKHLAVQVDAKIRRLPLNSILSVRAYGLHGGQHQQLEVAVNEVIAEFKKNGPTAEELNSARAALKIKLISRFERLGGGNGTADVLSEYNHFTGDPGYLAQELQQNNQVTKSGAVYFAEKYLNGAQSVVVYGIDGKTQIADVSRKIPSQNLGFISEKSITTSNFGAPTELWRNTPPEPLPTPAFTEMTPSTFKLANGLTVKVIERHNLPTFTLQVVAVGGTTGNPIDKAGLGLLTAKVLTRGTEQRAAEQFANELEQSGTLLTAGSAEDYSWVSTYGLTSSLTKSFDLVSDAILHPTFAPKEIDITKKQGVNSYTLGERILRRQLFGTENPLSYDTNGIYKSRKSISRTDLVNCWKNRFVPGNCALIVTGDVTLTRVKQLAEKYFSGWSGAAANDSTEPVVKDHKQSIFIFDDKQARQTSVTIGCVGIPISSPDYYATALLNDVLGGLASSRLNANLRSTHGYTYFASSRFNYYLHSGIFSINSRVHTEETALAVTEIMREISKIHNEPIPIEEFDSAKNNWSMSRSANFETTQDAARYYSNKFIYDSADYSDVQSQIEATTVGDVEIAAKKYLDPTKMIIVIVGDKKKIEPELKKLNFGPIVETDRSGNPY